MTIEITDTMKEYVDRKVQTGTFKDSNAVVQALFDAAIRAEARAKIDGLLLEAADQIDHGECSPWQPGEARKLLQELIRGRQTTGKP
jgi:Arc/MetJ-type ribon-helix-helix transcriptional regulator